MKRSTIDIWVGAFVAAGFAGLLFLALKVGNLASLSGADQERGSRRRARFERHLRQRKLRGHRHVQC